MRKLIKGEAHLYIPILVFILIAASLYFLFKTRQPTLNTAEITPSQSANSPTLLNPDLTPLPTEESSSRARDGCVISGCSSEICSDEEMFSTCVLKAENTCYETAICEKQQSGECGWTQSNELSSCLDKYNN